jgi:type IV secretory pathway VirD2 relaxase
LKIAVSIASRLINRSWKDTIMADDDLKPKLGRIRDTGGRRPERLKATIFRQTGTSALTATWSKGHISPGALRRGMGTGVRAAAGLIAPGSRRVIVKARYTRMAAGHLGAAHAHLKYIQRDGVTRQGEAGQLYDATRDDADGRAFLDRSTGDPHQFRFIVSADDSNRLADLKPFIRDLLGQMAHDLDTKLDWVAVDHFNTGHPHTHVVIRGRDDQGRDLVMARDYIGHGVRARAKAIVTLALGPESPLERLRKLIDEVGQERLTRIDRTLLARATDGILVVTARGKREPFQRSTRIGRLRTLQRLGLAEERQTGVWQLDGGLEAKLRRLGERADKFKMMQRALQEAGIDRAASELALFEKTPRKVPLIGKVVGVGMVDEITDRTWVVLDAIDGRVHYAELGRLSPEAVPKQGCLAALAGNQLDGKPSALPRLEVLSLADVAQVTAYAGPTWLDEAILRQWRPDQSCAGFAVQLDTAIAGRGRWLIKRQLATFAQNNRIVPASDMMTSLRVLETKRLVDDFSRELKSVYIPNDHGSRVSGIYDRAIATPTSKLAVIRNADTFTLAPWKPALEPMRGQAVSGVVRSGQVMWTRDRGRGLPGRR